VLQASAEIAECSGQSQGRKCAAEDNGDMFVDKSELCGKSSIPLMMTMIPKGDGWVECTSGRA
jgi:hypothetical protein